MTTWSDGPAPTSRYDGTERHQASREPLVAQILATLFPHREPAPEQAWLGPCDHELEAG